MKEKNFKVSVSYTEQENNELELALAAYEESTKYFNAAKKKYEPMIQELSEAKADAILEQCMPLIEMADKFYQNNEHKKHDPLISCIYDYGVGSVNKSRLYIYIYSKRHAENIENCVQVSNNGHFGGYNSYSIFEKNNCYVEKLLSIWNSENIYGKLKDSLLQSIQLSTKLSIDSANKLSNRANALIDD